MATATLTAPVTTKTAWAGRVISTLLVLFLLFDGVMKLFKPAFVLEACAKLGVPESAVVPIGQFLIYSVASSRVRGLELTTAGTFDAASTWLTTNRPGG